ncbi:MBL fold metallo-hydrolase [Actinocatenispora sera]|uniref:MBL fold metallo-hydrolase n=1 Tax=Actinocatenispora sera TaxID=390989 RepID=UPI00340B0FAC
MDVTMLCDAVAMFPEPVEEALPGWAGRHRDWAAGSAPGNAAAAGWVLHVHCFLLTDEGRATLVDTGVGPAGAPGADWLGTAGRLPALLAEAGVTPAEIDTVVLTHVHLDHAGWNIAPAAPPVRTATPARTGGDVGDHRDAGTGGSGAAGGPLFARAEYVVQRAELDHVAGTGTYARLVAPVRAAGQLRVVDGETTMPGGYRLLPTPGHTPGHQSVLTDGAVLAGDVLVHPAQARWPELPYRYETGPGAAVDTRRRLLRYAAEHGVPLAPAHLRDPLDVGADLTPTAHRPVALPATARCPLRRLSPR